MQDHKHQIMRQKNPFVIFILFFSLDDFHFVRGHFLATFHIEQMYIVDGLQLTEMEERDIL